MAERKIRRRRKKPRPSTMIRTHQGRRRLREWEEGTESVALAPGDTMEDAIKEATQKHFD